MTALSHTFTSYLSYIASFFVSGTLAVTGDNKLPTAALKNTVEAVSKVSTVGQDPASNIIVNILLFFFDKTEVVILNGAIYLHGILLTQILSFVIAFASLFVVIMKGTLELLLVKRRWKLDKLEREIAELNDD